ncbi:MAG: hypothetical protein C0183_12370 [Roseiflexus castenholzii]|uniref:DGQHR domain-containing protein n=1 Tax=Roseiflexus castenholzii TaxID=120962 RepID=UPI000CB45388|nr:MAG: hypothetical protein C0183_12370 [Roseiflexus castenholzii]
MKSHDKNEKSDKIALPALRLRMGDWMYYVTFMSMRDIAERISVAEEIHVSKSLNELIQRQLTNRSKQIKDYLLSQPQRFFNALVIGVYGGSPDWYELDISNEKHRDLEQIPEGVLGVLVLDGSEKLFAIDGQHRVVGIREAVKESRKIEDDEVSAIFVAHRNDYEGLERTRRLFTTLNRYAKPVSKQEIIALDEDDVVAIVTRHLVEKHPLFRDKVSLAKGKNIPINDKSNFTTIIALYDALDIFLKKDRSWANFKKSRPDDGKIKDFYDKSSSFWDLMIKYFEPLKEMGNSKSGSDVASKYRRKDGGHLLFRPVGLLIVVRVIRHFIDSGLSLDDSVQRIAKIPMDLGGNPWVGLLWDATNQRMITASENQKVGVKLLFYATGGDLSRIGTNPEKLKKELAGIQNVELSKINLQKYV